MQTIDIINEVQKLPLDKKLIVIEEIIKSIKMDKTNYVMESAVNRLYSDYAKDSELTVFTSLDFENFYEAR